MADLDRRTGARLTRAIWSARAVMLWEQGARVWAPWLLAVAGLAVAALWGLFDGLASPVRIAVLGAAAVAALVFSVRGALSIRWPGREAARARLEADSRLEHGPLAALEDAPVAGDPGLWALHRQVSIDSLAAARIGRPKAGLAAADPLALRWALIVAAALALWARGPERVDHVAQAFAPPERLADLGDGAQAVGRTIKGWFSAPVSKAVSRAEARAETPAEVRGE
jgi:hypothetical protein